METLDPATEWRRLSERYRSMNDDELLALAGDVSEMTDVARQALAQEMSQRRLKPEAKAPTPKVKNSNSEDEDPYAQQHELVDICTVWSLADARKLQALLDEEGVPFYIGPEKATTADAVTSNFAKGLTVQVMRVGLPWAQRALERFTPADAPGPKEPEEPDGDLAIHCPKCHSTDVIFNQLADGSDASVDNERFDWTCASCGTQWEDEGVETKD